MNTTTTQNQHTQQIQRNKNLIRALQVRLSIHAVYADLLMIETLLERNTRLERESG